jgi:hypothetical protein
MPKYNYVALDREDGLRSIFDGDTTIEEAVKYT